MLCCYCPPRQPCCFREQLFGLLGKEDKLVSTWALWCPSTRQHTCPRMGSLELRLLNSWKLRESRLLSSYNPGTQGIPAPDSPSQLARQVAKVSGRAGRRSSRFLTDICLAGRAPSETCLVSNRIMLKWAHCSKLFRLQQIGTFCPKDAVGKFLTFCTLTRSVLP